MSDKDQANKSTAQNEETIQSVSGGTLTIRNGEGFKDFGFLEMLDALPKDPEADAIMKAATASAEVAGEPILSIDLPEPSSDTEFHNIISPKGNTVRDLLNLLLKATPEQREELANALHVAQQISVADKAYEGAPKADFYGRLRAASNINKFMEALHGELQQDENYKLIKAFSRQLDLACVNGDFRDWIGSYRNLFTSQKEGVPTYKHLDAAWKHLQDQFATLVKDLTIIEIINVVEVLNEEGNGVVSRRYSVGLTPDKRQVIYTITGMGELVLHDIEQ